MHDAEKVHFSKRAKQKRGVGFTLQCAFTYPDYAMFFLCTSVVSKHKFHIVKLSGASSEASDPAATVKQPYAPRSPDASLPSTRNSLQ